MNMNQNTNKLYFIVSILSVPIKNNNWSILIALGDYKTLIMNISIHTFYTFLNYCQYNYNNIKILKYYSHFNVFLNDC